jgi:hypothetical protein
MAQLQAAQIQEEYRGTEQALRGPDLLLEQLLRRLVTEAAAAAAVESAACAPAHRLKILLR